MLSGNRAPASLFVAGLLISCFGVGLWAQERPTRKSKSKAAPVADTSAAKSARPFTLDQTVTISTSIAKMSAAVRQQMFENYRSRGLEFKATPDVVEKLRSAGADGEFLDLIIKLGPPPPPPPPRIVTGNVEAGCGPAECEVTLNKQLSASTKEGKFVFEGVPPGEATVAFSKPGYTGASRQVKVQPGLTASATVTLEPNEETKRKLAKEALDKVWAALGAGNRGSTLQAVSAGGSASLFNSAGVESHWGVAAKLSDTQGFNMDLLFPSGKLAFKFQCDPCKIVRSSGNPFAGKGKVAIDQDEASILLTKFRSVHLGNMISRLTAPEVRVLSAEPQPSGGRIFKLEGNDEAYELEVGPNLLVTRVFVTLKYGGDPYGVIYSDYVKFGEASQYPRRTEFHMHNGKRGAKIEFTGAVSKLS